MHTIVVGDISSPLRQSLHMGPDCPCAWVWGPEKKCGKRWEELVEIKRKKMEVLWMRQKPERASDEGKHSRLGPKS